MFLYSRPSGSDEHPRPGVFLCVRFPHRAIVYVSARTKVSIFALPIFGTDYILVNVDSLAAALSPAGYDVSCLG